LSLSKKHASPGDAAEEGADVQLKSDDGCTALDLAIHVKHTAAEAVIRKHLAKAKLEAKAVL